MSETRQVAVDNTHHFLGAHADTPLAQAQAKLAASRARLRRQFIPPLPPTRGARASGSGSASRWLQNLAAGPWQALRKLLSGNPVAEAAVEGVTRWWTTHPLRDTAELAGSEIAGEWRRSGVPLLRRHPVASVAIAAAAGATLVIAKPWRSTRVRAKLRPLPRRMGSWLMAQVPLQTVLTGLVVMFASRGQSGSVGDGGAAHSTSDASSKAMN